MRYRFTEQQTLNVVARLSKRQLASFIETECVTPALADTGYVFTKADLARLELLCDLSEDFDFSEDAMTIILSLIDQLHGARAALRMLNKALEAEPPEVRARIANALEKQGL